jgi:hypothetical protein
MEWHLNAASQCCNARSGYGATRSVSCTYSASLDHTKATEERLKSTEQEHKIPLARHTTMRVTAFRKTAEAGLRGAEERVEAIQRRSSTRNHGTNEAAIKT